MTSIDEKTIVKRKQTLVADLEIVRGKLVEDERKKLEDTALINALTGAIQQCDDFLKRLNDVSGDDGNEAPYVLKP
jgi:hypothetical protein